MNKEEKIGMYTREEILDYMQDCEGSMLGRSMYDAVMSKIDTLQSQLDIANKKLEDINKIVSSYGIQSIPSGLGECPVEVLAYELNNIYKLSIIGGE